MEVAAGIVAEHCYQDRKFHRELLDDPYAVTSRLISKEVKRSFDVKEVLPNCKLHPLKNDNKHWHIVLPFEYDNKTPSLESGILTEDELEQVVGGIFGLVSATSLISFIGSVASNVVIATLGSSSFVVTATAAAHMGIAGAASTFLSTGVVAGITAGIVGGGVALSAGVAISAIAGLDAASIIDAW